MKIVNIFLLAVTLVACTTAMPTSQLANPAAVKCRDEGYRLEIRKDAQGNEYGMCIDADGKECEEWTFFRGECTLWRRVRHR